MSTIDRRSFLASAGAAAGAIAGATHSGQGAWASATRSSQPDQGGGFEGDGHRGACVISSGNGIRAVEVAMQRLAQGADPADAIVEGVGEVENDPTDMSVGYGGLPNEDGVVQLDASVMHGPLHKAGAVAAIERIKNPAAVALLVLKRTDHVLIVGDGARRFAVAHGFLEQDLLTNGAREAWLRWKRNLNDRDDWLDDGQSDFDTGADKGADAGTRGGASSRIPFTYGTIHCSAVTDGGDLAGCTSTSGLSYKIPGRVGDSPIVGAGMYTDNDVGSAGATGRGEAVIQSCGAFSVVEHMARGLGPTEACLAVLKRIADRTKQKRLLDERGRPNFNVTLYAVRKDGAYGSASIMNRTFAVHDADQSRIVRCAGLYED